MRHVLIFILLVFLAISVSAIEIQAPERIPSYAPFTFRAVLPATDTFTQASILFDNVNVATIYPSGACAIDPKWEPFLIHCKTFDANPQNNEGLTTVVTHTGFAKGTHEITVSSQGPQSEHQTVSVLVFDALDASVKEEITAQIGTIQTTVDTLQTDATTAKENAYATQQKLDETTAETTQKIEEIQAKLSLDEQAKAAAEAEAKANPGFQIPFLSSTPGTGFASGSNAPLIGVGILVALALLVFYFTRVRKKEGFGAPTKAAPFFEGSMDALFKGLPGSNTDAKDEPQKKKWSSDVEGDLREDVENNPPERNNSKIHFSDIIQKERD